MQHESLSGSEPNNESTPWDILVEDNSADYLEDDFGEDSESYEDSDDYDSNYSGYDEEYDEDEDYDDYEDYEDEPYYELERSEFNEKNLKLFEMDIPQEILDRYPFINELPDSVAIIGGTARSIAREIITGDREPIRDIDLVNITDINDSELDQETAEALAQKFMPDDFEFGHGIQSESLEHYFSSRDFTINQCLVAGGRLIVSDFAYNDLEENIIRPTYFEHPDADEPLRSRLFFKALMMQSVLSQVTKSYPTLEDVTEPEQYSSFDIALFLNKAMSRGAETARAFTHNLWDWDFIDAEYSDKPMALATSLINKTYNFEFRPTMDKHFQETEDFDSLDDFLAQEAMHEYHAGNPEIRDAIAEYGEPTGERRSKGERKTGHYTQAEYDKINRSRA